MIAGNALFKSGIAQAISKGIADSTSSHNTAVFIQLAIYKVIVHYISSFIVAIANVNAFLIVGEIAGTLLCISGRKTFNHDRSVIIRKRTDILIGRVFREITGVNVDSTSRRDGAAVHDSSQLCETAFAGMTDPQNCIGFIFTTLDGSQFHRCGRYQNNNDTATFFFCDFDSFFFVGT